MRLAVVAGKVVGCGWDRCWHDRERRRRVAVSPMQARMAMLHGGPVTYAEAGAGPVLLLVHGMGGGCEDWREVINPLARRYTVVAPDLSGHGASPPGNGDYSIGALAAGLRNLLLALGH
jgi:pimeloyl-ACP methyl ester carboxylesterase